MLDASGQIATGQIFAYDAFGNRIDANQSVATLTDLLYTGERFDPSLGQYYWRTRPYFAADGRFSQFDSYAGSASDPASLHKYAYAANEPLLYDDASGHEFSLVSLMVGGAIAGAVGGFTIGAYKGAIQAGKVLSWKTLEYGLIGAAIGAGIGAAAGAGLYYAGGYAVTLARAAGPGSWLYDFVLAAHGTRMPVFGAGMLAGFTLGFLDAPAAAGIVSGPVEAALTTFLNAYGRDQWIWSQSAVRIHASTRAYFEKVLFRNWVDRPVEGYGIARALSFWGAWFFAGFTVGYYTSKAIAWTTDKATDWIDGAETTYSEAISEDSRQIDQAPN